MNTSAIAPAIPSKIGSFAPQEKNGITLTVAIFSLSSASVLVLIIAGTEQPKPIIIGIRALPDKPNLRNNLSKIKATRAIYPVSSIIEKNKNNNKICGRNPKIANKPVRTPSQRKPVNQCPSPNVEARPPFAVSIIALNDISNKLYKITPGELIPFWLQNNPS